MELSGGDAAFPVVCDKCKAALVEGICPSCKTMVIPSLSAASPSATSDFCARPALPQEVVEASRREKNLFGKYILIEKIGQGGMGVVYRAWDTSLNRSCAVKRLLPNLDAESGVTYREQAERFLREARMAAKLSHPNIVQVYDVGAVGEARYIAMEHVPGETLKNRRDRITTEEKKGGSTSRVLRDRLEKTLWIMHDVIKAVGHAHKQGIVHRDVKPENIFLTAAGESVIPKVGDFGLAKEVGESRRITLSGTALGTPYYMSPEQAEGKREIDARSDVFSLGSVLYEMATGTMPFEGEGVVEIMKAVVEKDPPLPRKLNRAIDGDLQTIVMKALEKEPRRRYADGEEFAEDLKRYLLGETIKARPATLVYRIGKNIRRHRVASALVGSAMILLLAVGAYAIVSGLEQKEKVRGLEGEKAQAEKDRELQDRAVKIAMQGWMIVSEVAAEFYKRDADMGRVWKRLEAAVGKLDESIVIYPTALAHFYRGRIHLLRLDYDLAERDFTTALSVDKEFPEAYLFRSATWMAKFAEQYVDPRHRKEFRAIDTGAYLAKAAEDIRSISGSQIKEEYLPFRHLAEAFALLDEKDTQPCLKKMKEGYELFKKEEFLYWAGVVEYIRNEESEVRRLLSRAVEVRPQYPEAITVLTCLDSDDDKQIDAFSKAIAINPRFASAYLNRGDVYRGKKENGPALEDFDKVVHLRPGWPVAYEHRGSLRKDMGDLAGALKDLDKAIQLSPGWAHLYERRGSVKEYMDIVAMARRKERERVTPLAAEAMKDYDTAIKLDPVNGAAYYSRGIMKNRQGDKDGAIADYTKALEIKPSENLYSTRAQARENKGDLPGALEDYTAAIALGTTGALLPGLYHLRGQLLWEMREYDRAIEDYDSAIALDPGVAGFFYDRGVSKMYKDDLNGATVDFDRAIEIDPKNILSYYWRGRFCLGRRDPDKAIENLTKAIEIDPKFETTFYNAGIAHTLLGNARAMKGDDRGAIAEWEKAFELFPNLKNDLLPRIKRAEERLKLKGS